MKLILVGDNDFEISRELKRLSSEFDGAVVQVDAVSDDSINYHSLLFGQSLFADRQLIIIRNLGENVRSMELLSELLNSETTNDILIAIGSVDKRLKAYKRLVENNQVKELNKWSERDHQLAESWLINESEKRSIKLSRSQAQKLVQRLGTDQWLLNESLDKLELLDEINDENIEAIAEFSPNESAFNLIDAIMQANKIKINKLIDNLERSEDPYRLFGLVTSQFVSLVAIASHRGSESELARDLSVNPYVIKKLLPKSKLINQSQIKKIVEHLRDADMQLKTSTINPWLILRQSLIKIADI